MKACRAKLVKADCFHPSWVTSRFRRALELVFGRRLHRKGVMMDHILVVAAPIVFVFGHLALALVRFRTWLRCACGVGGRHRVHSMPHHELSAVVIVIRVGGVDCELSTCQHRLTSFSLALLLEATNFSAIVVCCGLRLPILFGLEAPPSSEGSSMASSSTHLCVHVVFVSSFLALLPSISNACYVAALQ